MIYENAKFNALLLWRNNGDKRVNFKLFFVAKQPYVLHKVHSSVNTVSDKNGLLRVKYCRQILYTICIHWLPEFQLTKNNVLIKADDRAIICDFVLINVVNVPHRRLCSSRKFTSFDILRLWWLSYKESKELYMMFGCSAWCWRQIRLNEV